MCASHTRLSEVAIAVARFEAAWATFSEDTAVDVAFRCRQMAAKLRSTLGVTTLPSMPVD
jgi:hypothetical protein